LRIRSGVLFLPGATIYLYVNADDFGVPGITEQNGLIVASKAGALASQFQ
jgi:hypothetical protein